VGPFIGAAIAAFYHQFVLRASGSKSLGSFRSAANVWVFATQKKTYHNNNNYKMVVLLCMYKNWQLCL